MSSGMQPIGSGIDFLKQRKEAEEKRWKVYAAGDQDAGIPPCPQRFFYEFRVCCLGYPIGQKACDIENCAPWHFKR